MDRNGGLIWFQCYLSGYPHGIMPDFLRLAFNSQVVPTSLELCSYCRGDNPTGPGSVVLLTIMMTMFFYVMFMYDYYCVNTYALI